MQKALAVEMNIIVELIGIVQNYKKTVFIKNIMVSMVI